MWKKILWSFVAKMLDGTSYDSLEDAERALKQDAVSQGFYVNRLRSKKSKTGEIRKVWYVCIHGRKEDKSRTYINHNKKKRDTTSRRICCPWGATAKRADGCWCVELNVTSHNHEMASDPSVYHENRVLAGPEKQGS